MRPYLADPVIPHPTRVHPHTGEPLLLVGTTPRGRLLWPVLGASPDDDPGDSGGNDGGDGDQGDQGAAGDGERGYPLHTPVAEMTDKQQAAYYKQLARKHEDRVKALKPAADKAKKYDEHVAANQTEQEKAVEAAKTAARTEALTEAGERLVAGYFRAAVKAKLTADKAASLVEGINTRAFLGDDMLPDTDKIDTYLATLLPASGGGGTGSGPDMGQGRRDGDKPSGLAAGAAEYEARRPKRAGATT